MNRISFFLKRPKENRQQTVFAYVRMNGQQLKVYTGISLFPGQWNSKRQRVKSSYANAATFNDHLDRITRELTALIFDLRAQNLEPTPELVKKRYRGLTSHASPSQLEKSLCDHFEDWIMEAKATKRGWTIKNYQTTLTHLKDYGVNRGASLTFDRIDRAFVNALTKYLIQIRELENSTTWKTIKTLKTFMKWAVERGLTRNSFMESVTQAKFGFRLDDKVVIRLTENELRQLVEIDLSDAPHLDNARNLFVLQCSIGVRFGDLHKIVTNPSAYRQGHNIQLTTQKNRKPVLIPLLPLARTLLDERAPLHPISNQRLNDFIKEVAQRAKITRHVTITSYKGTTRLEETKQLCDVLTTHMAKRTFISLMAAHGITRDVIKSVTGNTDATLDRYLKLNESEITREMQKAANFLA